MKKIILALALITSLTFSSCSSDDKAESNGISTGDYWPMALNNTWNFFGDGMNSEIKVVGTKVFDGKTYFEIKDNTYLNSDLKGYMIKEGATYFQRIDDSVVNENGLLITIDGYEIPFFKDNIEANDTWKGSVNTKARYNLNGNNVALNVRINYDGTILATNATETLNDVTYTDVIKMRMLVSIVIEGQTQQLSVDYWLAKNLGPIKTIESGAGVSINRSLLNYSIN